MAVDFMKHFPFPTMRAGQKTTLEIAQETINDWEVLVVRAPVGSGKSGIAVSIQAGLNEQGWGCNIIVPNNLLRDQYTSEFPFIKTVKGQHEYIVPASSVLHGRRRLPFADMSVKEFRRQYGTWPRGNQYTKDLGEVRKKTTPTVLNYYAYMAHAKTSKTVYKDVLIIDEAHKMLETLKDIHATRIWQHKVKYPDGLRSFGELIDWAERNEHKDHKIATLLEELNRKHPASVIEYSMDFYRGEQKHCIKIKPLTVADKAPFFWPERVKRIILMSATISPKDIEMMGLGDRVVKYVDTPSPIPKEHRAILPLNTCSMAYRSQEANLDKVVHKIKELAASHAGESGMIHAPYSLASKLKTKLHSDDRFLFHTRLDKNEKLEQFKSSKGKILLGSGFYEGIDLKYELARWQVVLKIPYPNLSDSSNRWISKNDSEYYAWLTARELLQASGRVCRAEDDYGVTYVLDSCWSQWYNTCERLLPLWFRESVTLRR